MGDLSMRFFSAISVIAIGVSLCVVAPAGAKDTEPKYKTVEAKHFDRSEGVELAPEFSDYLYAELRTQLQKTKMFGQVIGEGEVVDDADVASSVVVTGTLTEYKKGSVVKAKIIGYGAGQRSLKVDVNVLRRSDQKILGTLHVKVRAAPNWNEKVLAVEAAKTLAKEIKDTLHHAST
jgi:hypothetical protein